MANGSSESIKMNFKHESEDQSRAFPRHRQKSLKWQGWGYKDCEFKLTDEENRIVEFNGDRYEALANETLPRLGPWFEEYCDAGKIFFCCCYDRYFLNIVSLNILLISD